jgi:hypothetical protein
MCETRSRQTLAGRLVAVYHCGSVHRPPRKPSSSPDSRKKAGKTYIEVGTSLKVRRVKRLRVCFLLVGGEVAPCTHAPNGRRCGCWAAAFPTSSRMLPDIRYVSSPTAPSIAVLHACHRRRRASARGVQRRRASGSSDAGPDSAMSTLSASRTYLSRPTHWPIPRRLSSIVQFPNPTESPGGVKPPIALHRRLYALRRRQTSNS